jgi:hypothetical protein
MDDMKILIRFEPMRDDTQRCLSEQRHPQASRQEVLDRAFASYSGSKRQRNPGSRGTRTETWKNLTAPVNATVSGSVCQRMARRSVKNLAMSKLPQALRSRR